MIYAELHYKEWYVVLERNLNRKPLTWLWLWGDQHVSKSSNYLMSCTDRYEHENNVEITTQENRDIDTELWMTLRMRALWLQWRHNGCDTTSLTIVYSAVYLYADQWKHQSSASLGFVRGILRGPLNSPHKRQVRGKCLYLMTSSCFIVSSLALLKAYHWNIAEQ